MQTIENLKTSLPPKRRALLLLLVVVVVLAVLVLTVFRGQVVSLFRQMTYGQNDDFSHNAQSSSLFIGLEDNLLVCTQSQIQLFSPTGTAHIKEAVTMSSPAVNVSGDYAVVYDVGGQELRVVQGEKLVHTLTLSDEDTFLCATVNEKGWVATTTKVGGYKGVVTVYNTSFEEVLAIRLSSRYVSDAVVTPDCRGVYLVSPGQAEGAFENTLLYYTFSSKEEPTKEVSLGSNVVLSIRSAGKCWILGDQSLMILDSSGVITATYDYDGQYLKMGSLQGDNFAALFLSISSSGNSGDLVTVGSDGKAYGSLTIEGQTLAMAAQGHDVGVLTTGKIYTAPYRLGSYTEEANQTGIRNLALYSDGSAALIGSSAVSLYFPSGSTDNDTETEETT
jgi:hypothetical protein